MGKPRLLDLFSGAGGAARGYQLAGFHVTGVDLVDQPRYAGDVFHQGDALTWPLEGFDVIHASPPCQAYSTVSGAARHGVRDRYPDLVEATRERLVASGVPYVLENVVGAPLVNAIRLCGSSFGLDVQRHRLFETNPVLLALVPPCAHHWQRPRFRSLDNRARRPAAVVGVHGHLNYPGEQAIREAAMGIDWMTPQELTQAIPPAYTSWIGAQLMEAL